MLDLANWCQRAVAFTEALRGFPGKSAIKIDLGHPYTREHLRDLSAACPLPIPDPLVDWNLSVGSCHCTYRLDIPVTFADQMRLAFPYHKMDTLWGGADLIDLSDALYMVNDFREIAPCFQEAGFSNDARLWGNSFPFIREGNADIIGLYLGEGAADPPVAHLCHELCGASQIISPSFEQFLRTWEAIGYIGCHYLHCFINPATGLLDASYRRDAVQAMHLMFRGIPQTEP